MLKGWVVEINGQQYPADVHFIKQAYYGLKGKALIIMDTAVPVDLTKNQLMVPFVLYADNDGNLIRVASGYITDAEVITISPNKRAVKLTLAGVQRAFKDVNLTLKPYASNDQERSVASTIGTVSKIDYCDLKCSDPIITSVGADLATVFGTAETWDFVWDPPALDQTIVTTFTATLSDGTIETVPLTKEAVVKKARCVPQGGCPATAPCGAELDPEVGARYCCYQKWNSISNLLFNENLDLANKIDLGLAGGSPLDNCSPISGQIGVSYSDRFYCTKDGCLPTVQPNSWPCDIPDLEIVDNVTFNELVGIDIEPSDSPIETITLVPPLRISIPTSISLSWTTFSIANLASFSIPSGINVNWSTVQLFGGLYLYKYANYLVGYRQGKPVCKKPGGGNWWAFSCCANIKIPDLMAIASAIFEFASQIATSIWAWFLKYLLKPVFDFVTWGTDIVLRMIGYTSAIANLIGAINNCIARSTASCHDVFCKKWANLIEYDPSKIAASAGIANPAIDTFFIAMTREQISTTFFDLVNIVAFLDGKIMDWSDGPEARTLGQKSITMDGCNAGVQMSNSEFNADIFTLLSPVIPRKTIESWLAEQIEAGADLSCLPYKLADFMENPVMVSDIGGASKEVKADLLENPELVRAFLTHKNAGLMKIVADLNEFPALLTAKPGDEIAAGTVSLYIVDIEYQGHNAVITVVRPDTIAKVEVLPSQNA